MTQVSKIPLSKSLENQMHLLFRRVIVDLHTESDVTEFFDDILSPTEKTMLGKRLAIAILIEQGYDHRAICKILHVSLATVSTVHYWLKNRGEGYRKVIHKILREEKWKKQLDTLNGTVEAIVSVGKNAYYPKPPKEFKPRDMLI
jgi:uncharacterized protein YerC